LEAQSDRGSADRAGHYHLSDRPNRVLERRLEASQRDDVNPDKTVLVRIPRRRAFVLRGEWDVLNENDVWVLLAITSKIGRSDYAVTTRKEIAFRATGAKDEKQWRDFGRTPLLSEHQIAYSVHKLAERMGLVSRVLGRKVNIELFLPKTLL